MIDRREFLRMAGWAAAGGTLGGVNGIAINRARRQAEPPPAEDLAGRFLIWPADVDRESAFGFLVTSYAITHEADGCEPRPQLEGEGITATIDELGRVVAVNPSLEEVCREVTRCRKVFIWEIDNGSRFPTFRIVEKLESFECRGATAKHVTTEHESPCVGVEFYFGGAIGMRAWRGLEAFSPASLDVSSWRPAE